jgi:hypothetical protein
MQRGLERDVVAETFQTAQQAMSEVTFRHLVQGVFPKSKVYLRVNIFGAGQCDLVLYK